MTGSGAVAGVAPAGTPEVAQQLRAHPRPVLTDYREGGWSADGIAAACAAGLGADLQDAGEKFLLPPAGPGRTRVADEWRPGGIRPAAETASPWTPASPVPTPMPRRFTPAKAPATSTHSSPAGPRPESARSSALP
ncbi:MAG: hypothetical protein ACRDOI_38785 [Trebonia sp.]